MATIFKYKSAKEYYREYFSANIKKYLTPLAIDPAIINAIEVNEFEQYDYLKQINRNNKSYYFNAHNEHYKVLKFISFRYNGIHIIDGGTHVGSSAFCLGLNKENTVTSYDIEKKDIGYSCDNIEFKILDLNKETDENLHKAFIILLDLDPHDGIQEKTFVTRLREIGWIGYLICDDIAYNREMMNFWEWLGDQPRGTLTDCGHWSGTGIVRFGEHILI